MKKRTITGIMDRSKRIILILDSLDLNGPAFAALNIIPDLLTAGCAILVMARRGGEHEEMFRACGCDIRLFPHLGVPLLGRSAIDAARRFAPGIVHAHSPVIARQALRIANAVGVSLVATINRLDSFEGLMNLKKSPRTHLIALSEAVQEKLINVAGFPRERITIIPHGLNLKFFPALEERAHSSEDRLPVVGTYGTLIEQKGQRDFLQAAKGVIKSGLDAEFLIMGHGPDKPLLRELAEQLQISRRLTFSASTITDSRNISNIDVFVEPTHREGFGMSVLQAMATGVPVVACGVGGIFSLIEDGKSGLLVSAGDIAGITKNICRLLRNPALRVELAHNARQRVEKEFNARCIAQRLLELYARLTVQ